MTADLIPVEVLLKLLNKARMENGFRPLYWGDKIYNYYPIMKTHLTSDEIIIEIPARTNEVFTWYKIIPFPTLVKGQDKGVILVINKPNILVSLSKANFAEVDDQTLERCRMAYERLICSHESIVTHLTSAYNGCPKSLVLNSMDDNDCNFDFEQEQSEARTTEQGTYLYFSTPTEVFLKCGENETRKENLVGNSRVGVGCSVRSKTWAVTATKKIYMNTSSRAHYYNVSSIAVLPELKQLNLTKIGKLEHKDTILVTKGNHSKWTLSLFVVVLLIVVGMSAMMVFMCYRPKCLCAKTVPVGVKPSDKTLNNAEQPMRQQEDVRVIVM